jgi:hypothetical protein
MMIRLTTSCILFGLLVLSYNCDAFVPHRRRAFQQSSRTTVVVSPTQSVLQQEIDNHVVFAQKHSSTTKLSMNLVNEFVTANDAKLRSKGNEQYLAELQKRVDKINNLELTIEELGDEELQAKTKEFQQRLADGEDINGPILEEAFAVVREAAW